MTLSPKQRAFVEHYLQTWNGAEAARLALYSEHTAREQASRLLTNVDIQAAIQSRLVELKMSADEVLTRLTDHARGSIAPFLITRAGGVSAGFDLSPDRPLHLVKKVTITDKGISLEIHDSQAALALLGKHHKLFTDKVEHTGADGGPILLTPVDYRAGLDALKPEDGDE